MGSDKLSKSFCLKNYQQLIKNYHIIVYERPGFKPDNIYKDAIYNNIESPSLKFQCTYIRKIIKEGKSIRYLVPDKVMLEIEQNNYYRNMV